MSEVYRQVRMTEKSVDVEHEGDGWSSYVVVRASESGTRVQVGGVRLIITGPAGGYHGELRFKDETIWEGDYRVPAETETSR